MSQSHAEIAAEMVARPFAEQNLVSLQAAQVHATLALVEQQARVADILDAAQQGPNYAFWTKDAS